ncbi:MAG: biopolymer transporter ExbD [Pseudomonadota bacterium]
MSLTPLIDVVFILLVFFMLETNFLRPHAIDFSQTMGSASAASDSVTVALEIHDDGSIWLNGERTDLVKLRGYAAQLSDPGDTKVILAVDPQVELQSAVNVMDLFNDYGIKNISLAAARRFEQ